MYIYLYVYTYIYVGGLEVGTRCPGGGCGVISRWPRHRNRARVYVPVCLPSKQGDAKQGDAHSGTRHPKGQANSASSGVHGLEVGKGGDIYM